MRYILPIISAILVGALIGSSITLTVVGNRMETLMVERETLISSLQDREEALRKLRENPTTRWITVRETTVILEADGTDRKTLENEIKALLNNFIGRRVEELDPVLVHDLFDGRLVQAGETIYSLEVKAVFIAPRVSLYVRAVQVPATPEG